MSGATMTHPRVLILPPTSHGAAAPHAEPGTASPVFVPAERGTARSVSSHSPSAPEAAVHEVTALLESADCEVVYVSGLAQAIRLLQRESFDAVVTAPELFTGPEPTGLAGRLWLMLDHIGEGVCLLDAAGHLLWSNRRLREWTATEDQAHGAAESAQVSALDRSSALGRGGDVHGLPTGGASPGSATHPGLVRGIRDQYREACAQARAEAETFAQASGPSASDAPPRCATERREGLRFGLDDALGRHFEVVCHAICDPLENEPCVLAIIRDETATRRSRAKIDAIDRAGRMLLRLDRDTVARLDVPQRLDILETKVRTAAHDLLAFDHFNIRLLDRKTNRIVTVISTGLPANAEIELFAEATGNGISGYVAATGRSYICTDIADDPLYLPGLDQARSSLTVPLRVEDEVVGIFNVESREPARFHEEDRQLAEIFGRYVAIALNVLDLLVVERHRTTGLLAEDLAQEISGPLNDIIAGTTALLADADPAIHRRLHTILESVQSIRGSLRAVGQTTGGLLGVAGCDKTARLDPVLEGKSILIVDDESDIRETIGELLTRRGCRIRQASDGREACELVAAGGFDLVLSDIRMPHANGYDVFSATKRANPATPVMLMTGFGYDPNHSIVKARREGLAAVLFKPFKAEALLTQVRKALLESCGQPR